VVIFAGRLIPEKRAPNVVPAVALAAREIAGVRGVIYGDGPQRAAVDEAIAALEDPSIVTAPGFVDAAELHAALTRALVMVLPSRREGYGLVVVEAAQCGIPSIVVRDADNAAVELIEEGVNGVIAASASPEDLAAAIVEAHRGGEAMRASTRQWFAANARRLSLEQSLETVLAAYEGVAARA
jgi:glycosyltransferase involved in cell wall biosynthesis